MSWNYCYKIKDNRLEPTNLLYSPTKNKNGDTLCMTWDSNDLYQSANKNLDHNLINFFFDREVRYLKIFKDRPWCPVIKQIDYENKKIFLEWNNESLNAIINDNNRDLDTECPTWEHQIFNMLSDINNSGYYKLALYPHCFFINKDGIIKTIDFYSMIEKSYPYVQRKIIEGMIGRDSMDRFNQATDNGMINFRKMFKTTMLYHLEKTWIKKNPFPDFYRKLIND